MNLAGFRNCLAEHTVHSLSLLWLAYHISVVEQCCQMVKYNTMFYKNGAIYMLVCMAVRRTFSGGY